MLEGPVGSLEALIETPPGDAGGACAVICHPHPLHHGTFRNKVVHTLARTCHGLGVPTVRFNFRGVGRSEGHYGELAGEIEDAAAVAASARSRWPGRALWMMGFSFGAVVAARLACREPCAGLVTVAPAVSRFASDDVAPACAWLIVQGDADELVDCDTVVEWVNSRPPGPELVVLRGVDHFFHGKLTLLRQTVAGFLAPRLGAHAA
jgi:hypothetical protein